MKKAAVAKHITRWLKDYLDKNHLNGFIIGISGGIDSAVTSTLCAQTGFPVLCLDLPIHQHVKEINRAKIQLDWLAQKYPQVETLKIDLSDSFDEMKKSFKIQKEGEKELLGLANTRARLRMTTLFYYAGLQGRVVVGTGNKIEDFGIGFYTKYGDGAVDISPIADLYKTEVFALGHYLKLPQEILEAQPTDGLFGDGRSDEDQIGASYAELEWAMRAYESGKSAEHFKGRKKTVFEIYQKRHKINRHKWLPIPVCKIPEALKA